MTNTISVPGTTTSLQPYILNYFAFEYPTSNALIAPSLVQNRVDQFTTLTNYTPSTLSRFDTTNIEDTNNVRYATNTAYDTVTWYIYDYTDILKRKSIVSHVLTFNNTDGNTILFRVGYTLKLTVVSTGFSTLVTVTNATMSSITFTTNVELPTQPLDYNIKITNVTTELYPKSYVFTETIANGIKPSNGALARVNLFSVEQWPNLKGVRTPTESVGLSTTINLTSSLNTHNSVTTGDVVLPTVSQSALTNTINSSTVSWYIYDRDVLTYSNTTSTTKFVYFTPQLLVPFPTGSNVRITNTVINYSKTFTVIVGTTTYILINSTDTFDTSNTIIDNIITTVYLQSQYQTTTRVTPRDRFFYFNVAPGLYAAATFQLSNFTAPSLGNLSKPLLSVKAAIPVLSTDQIKQYRTTATTNNTNVPPANSIARQLMQVNDTNIRISSATLTKQLFQIKGDGLNVHKASTITKQFQIVKSDTSTFIKLSASSEKTNIQSIDFTINPLGISKFNKGYFPFGAISNLTSGEVPVDYSRQLNVFHNVPEGVVAYATGQQWSSAQRTAYNTVNWIIYEQPILLGAAPTGSTQTIGYVTSSFFPLFYKDNYVQLDHPSYGFNVTVLILSASVDSITFATVNNLPTVLSGMRITSVSSPVYSQSYAFSKLVTQGYRIANNTPRENLFVVGLTPNLRGVNVFKTTDFSEATTQISANTLSLFDATKSNIAGDIKLQIVSQSGLTKTTNTNTVSWYIYEDTILKFTNTKTLIKTVWFAPQMTIPFVSGSSIKLTFCNQVFYATVITGTTISASFLQPDTNYYNFDTTNYPAYIESGTATVFPQNYINIEIPRGTPRYNFYMMYLKPSTLSSGIVTSTTPLRAVESVKSTAIIKEASVKLSVSAVKSVAKLGSDTTTLSVNNVFQLPKLKGDTTTLSVNNVFQLPKLKGDTTTLSVNNVFQLPKLAGDSVSIRTSLRLETFDNIGITSDQLTIISAVDNVIPIVGIQNTYTANVAKWYAYDQDVLKLTATAIPQYLTLFFTPNSYVIGQTIALVNGSFYCQTCTVISSTSSSVTVVRPNRFIDATNISIYVNTTITFNAYAVPYSKNGYVKLTNTSNNETVICQVSSSNVSSVTVIKPANRANYAITPSVYTYLIENASPSVYSATAASIYGSSANNRFARLTLLANGSIVRSFAAGTNSIIATGPINNPQDSVRDVVSKPTVTFSVASSTSYISWSPYSLPIIGRSGFSTTPSVANWYTYDKDIITPIFTPSTNLTIYVQPSLYNTACSYIRIVNTVNGYDKTFPVVSYTSNSFVIVDPLDLPLPPNNLFVYTGIVASFDTITHSNNSDVSLINKFSTNNSQVFNINTSINNLNKFLVSYKDTQVFDTPIISSLSFVSKISDVNSKLILDTDGIVLKYKVDQFVILDKKPTISTVTSTSKLAGDTVILTVNVLKSVGDVANLVTTYVNTDGVIEKFVATVADLTTLQTSGSSKIPIQFWN